MYKKLFYIIFAAPLYFFIFSCAQQGVLVGGPKDTIPPRIIKSVPNFKANHFKSDKVWILFDEYIQFKNIDQQFIISPPMEKTPEFVLKGKKAQVNFLSPLKDSTTYTLSFGNSIEDYHEGNPLKKFQFVFSTGSTIDSMSISGKVVEAFTMKPPKEAFVMIYKTYKDSTPMKQVPSFICRTDSAGNFAINYISKGAYRIFALKDMDNDYKYNQANEIIAYLDTLLTTELMVKSKTDSLKKGMVYHNLATNKMDTLKRDTVMTTLESVKFPNNISLFMFREDNAKQYITKYQRLKAGQCFFVFNRPVKDSIKVSILKQTYNDSCFIKEWNKTCDSVSYWIKDEKLHKNDSLMFRIQYQVKDSAGNFKEKIDTINMVFVHEKTDKAKSKKSKDAKKTDYLKLSCNVNNILDLNRNIVFESENPLSKIDLNRIKLFEVRDTMVADTGKKAKKIKKQVLKQIKYSSYNDSVYLRKFHIVNKWNPQFSYKLKIDSLAFIDIFNTYNDTLEYNFKIQTPEFYGTFSINLKNTGNIPNYYLRKNKNLAEAPLNKLKKGNYILQLLTEKEAIINQYHFNSDKALKIPYLQPQKYLLKIIYDENSNGKWDTGDYLKHIQPEMVIFYGKPLVSKSNWDVEIDWDFLK